MIMKIRIAESKDVNQLLDILSDTGWFDEYFLRSLEPMEINIKRHLTDIIKSNEHIIIVSETGNIITGYLSLHWLPYLFMEGREGFISELFIRNDFRGQGIGKKLIDYIKDIAKNKGCTRLSLLNGRNRDSYARNFYQKQGFIERENIANFVLKF